MLIGEKKILILGIGNYLMGDEGVGVHFINTLKKDQLPEDVDIIDGGTGGFQLMECLEQYDDVIMIDATLDQNPPGTIRLIEPRFSQDFPKAMSTHEIGLKDLVDALSLLDRLPRIHLFVVSVADIANLHIGLSPKVSSCLTTLMELVVEEIKSLRVNSPSEHSEKVIQKIAE